MTFCGKNPFNNQRKTYFFHLTSEKVFEISGKIHEKLKYKNPLNPETPLCSVTLFVKLCFESRLENSNDKITNPHVKICKSEVYVKCSNI